MTTHELARQLRARLRSSEWSQQFANLYEALALASDQAVIASYLWCPGCRERLVPQDDEGLLIERATDAGHFLRMVAEYQQRHDHTGDQDDGEGPTPADAVEAFADALVQITHSLAGRAVRALREQQGTPPEIEVPARARFEALCEAVADVHKAFGGEIGARDVADAVTAGLNEYLGEHEDQVALDDEGRSQEIQIDLDELGDMIVSRLMGPGGGED